jgi:hypothetical protein
MKSKTVAYAALLPVMPRPKCKSKLFGQAGCSTSARSAETLPKNTDEDIVGAYGLVDDGLRASSARPDDALPVSRLDGNAETGADGAVDLADDLEDSIPLALNIRWLGDEDG